jgi:exopolysaccharide biosynthesis polyprenyl glycosylphosphotransferase
MRNNASIVFSFFLIIGDALALTAAFTAAYIMRVKWDPRPLIEQIPAMDFLYTFLAVLPLWLLVHGFIGLYNKDTYEKRFSELGRLLVGSFIGILVVIGYDFVSSGELFPARLVPVYALALGFSFLVLFRTIARALRHQLFKYGVGISNILIIGNTPASEHIGQTVNDTRHSGMRVLGIVGKKAKGFAYFSSFKEAVESLPELPHGIVQTELYKDQEKNNEIMVFAQENHISYRFVPNNGTMFVGKLEVELFADLPLVAVHQTQLIGWGRIAKRIFDVFVSLLLLVLLSPILLLIAISIKLFDRRDAVFFKQVRLTRFNRKFVCYKFRTHKAGISGLSDEEAFKKLGKPELYKAYKANGYALDRDPRVSRIGRFLRLTSLDETPQLFNVLKGDLSLVGPRALIPAELDTYEKKHAVLSVKSGITGLAQISGRQDISFEERRKIDMFYVQNWSFWLDISILLRTLRVVITGSGAK